jgi:enamine deaminase RidA (YjgF/YER057c/UK114 family)
MQMPEDVEAQTRNCFATIRTALEDAGFSFAEVVRARYYLVDAADADRVLRICGEMFADVQPAATLVVVAGLLRPEMKVEIEVTAKRTTEGGRTRADDVRKTDCTMNNMD